MPLREYIQDSTESHSLLLRYLECRIWGPLCKPDLNLEEFNYKVIAMVGKGTFNNVYCCYQRNTRQTVAIKEIVVREGIADAPALIAIELTVLRELLHDNVVRLLETWSRGNRIYLVYEYLPFNLCSYIRQPSKSKGPDTRKYYMLQILSAVAHYHSLGILHRDLKPQNILIDNIMLKLANFGLASAVGVPDVAFTSEIPRYYSAPELLLGSHLYSTAADMWSVGCIFGEMVTGRALFRGKSKRHQLKKIFRLLGTPTEDSWPGVTAQFEPISSLSSFPRFEPADLSEKFSGLEPEGLDLLSQMLVLDPAQRISASDAIGHPYFPPFPQPPESQGTDSGQGTSGSNSGQGPSGSNSGQGPSGSHSGQGPSGSHSGQGPSGSHSGQGTSGASSGQAASDHTDYLTLEVCI